MTVPSVRIPAYPVDESGMLLVDQEPIRTLHGEEQTREVFLGRLPAPRGRAALNLAQFMEELATIPPPVSYSEKALRNIRNPLGNNQKGNCVVASGGHGVAVWSSNDEDSGGMVDQTAAEAISEYHRIGGPGDNGLVVTVALNDFMRNGMLAAGKRHKIDGWAAVPQTREHVWTAIKVFGSMRIAFWVPSQWTSGLRDGFVWKNVDRFNSIGGHDVRLCGASEFGVEVCTWGLLGTMEWDALLNSRIVDELYVELSPNWYNNDQLTPSGFNVGKMREALQKVKDGVVPPWQSDPVPPVPPVPPTPPAPSKFPVYTGTVKLPWFGDAPIRLTPELAAAVSAHIDWEAVFKDGKLLIEQLKNRQLLAALQTLHKLLHDFGLLEQAKGFSPVVPWRVVIADAVTLVSAVMRRDWNAAVAALLKLAEDFGLDAFNQPSAA